MNSKNLFQLSAATALVVALAGLTSGCNKASAQAQTPPPPAVTVAPVEQKEIVEWSDFTGRTAPVDSVEIRPRVSGYIQEVRFKSGQLVNKGDVLFVIDPRWNQATYDQRQAVYEQAKSEADRTDTLLKNNAISKEEAEARNAHYLAAKADLDSAKLDLDYTEVRAPINGRVSRALLTEGNYVSGNAGGASLLTTVVSVNPVYVYANLDEDTYLKFNRLASQKKLESDGDGEVPVGLELADEDDFPHTGHIESFDNQLDPNTGSILVRAVFNNDDGRIVPGLFAHIRIPLSERHEVVLVDEKTIGTDQANKFVLTLTSSNTVAYRQVELGPLADGKRIVRSGLEAGEKIVTNLVLQHVRPGMTVTPQTETETATRQNPSKLASR
ncbi:MAG TPA: efflux RND transporter periplasmic adaptor subunit [Candidatus Sulfotelmatobacter sp.]|nr:efflux RND transporter periplasmic adaptor subunit [Candidatus Sulfotelmatobacter sp.]